MHVITSLAEYYASARRRFDEKGHQLPGIAVAS